MLDINIRPLEKNKVLVEERVHNSDDSTPRYYVMPSASSDKFEKCRKGIDNTSQFQTVGTFLLSILSGAYVAGKVKSNIPIKLLAGSFAGVGVYECANKFDKMIDKSAQDNLAKKLDIEEITNDDDRIKKSLEISDLSSKDEK